MVSVADSKQYKLLKEIEAREAAEKSLYEFVKQAWPEIEGIGTPFHDGWHIRAVCEHLEAVVRRDIQQLIVNIPPRSSKTSIISICFTAWAWLNNPSEKFYYNSHSRDLAGNHSLKCRNLIESEWYQSRWGDRFKLLLDQNTKSRFENDKSGYREASSTGSKTAGKGGTILILDDPNDTTESDLVREGVNVWIDQSWSSRLNDRKTGCKIVVQQRTHEKDVTGHLWGDDWIKLILPLEYEPNRKCKTIVLPSSNGKVWEDPRHVAGEILWPAHWGPEQIKQMKEKELKTEYRISGQLQQRPSPESGGIIRRAWFQWWKYHCPPVLEHVIQSWDTALNEKKSNCYSACTTWGIFQNEKGVYNLLLLSLFRARMEYPELRAMAQRLYNNYNDVNPNQPLKNTGHNKADMVLVENKSSGASLVQELCRAGISATGFNPDKYGDKIARIRRTTHFMERGQIWLPALPPDYRQLRSFSDLFISQAALFPAGESRDLIDTLAQVLLRLDESGWLVNPKYDGDNGLNTSIKSPSRAYY